MKFPNVGDNGKSVFQCHSIGSEALAKLGATRIKNMDTSSMHAWLPRASHPVIWPERSVTPPPCSSMCV